MTHHPDDALLHDFVDGRLADDDRESVAFHLLDCPRCQAIVAATEELIDTGRESRREASAPADLWPLVAATTIHERVVRKHVLKSVRRELAIAAIVLVMLSSLGTLFGMRLAFGAGDDGGPRYVTRSVDRLAPRVSVSGLEELAELEKLKALEKISVQIGEGHGVGGSHPDMPAPPSPPDIPTPEGDGAARALADEFVAQLMGREARAFENLRRQGIREPALGQVEDKLFDSNRKLSQLRLAYHNAPNDAKVAEELEALFDARIAIIRAAAAELERSRR